MKNDNQVDIYKYIIEKELERTKSELSQAIADAKVNIGESAIEKMHTVNNQLRNWVVTVLVGATVTVLGFCGLGYSSISSASQHFIDSKLNDWLSFEKKGSIIKESLEQIRMETLVDALSIRLAKAKISGRTTPYFSLTEAEKSRLIAYMQDPNSNEMAFRDGAAILGALTNPFGYSKLDPQIDNLIKNVFSTKNYSIEKQGILLQALINYAGMYQYSLQIIESNDTPNSWKADAFKNISKFDDKKATDFATKNILLPDHEYMEDELAAHLAKRKEENPSLGAWLAKKSKEDTAMKYAIALNAASAKINSWNDSPIEKSAAYKQVASYLYGALSNGAKIGVCEGIADQESICLKNGTTSIIISRPSYIFKSKEFSLDLFKLFEKGKYTPEQIIRLLTAKSKYGNTLAVKFNIGHAILMGRSFGEINSLSSASSILLTFNSSNGEDGIYAKFRSADGNWVDDKIVNARNFYSGELSFSYDETIIDSMEIRENKNIDIGFSQD